MLKDYLERHRREAQLRQIEILGEIDKICRRNGLTYWLDGGTLLGAVRHGGFIPWDDDIDIAIPLSEMTRFTEVLQRELPPHLLLQTPETTPSIRQPICKVRDRNSFMVEFSDDFSRPYEKGLYVDVFPMLPYPSFSKKFVKRVARGYCRSAAILRSQHYYSLRSAAELFWFGAKKAYYRMLWSVGGLFRKKDKYYSNILCNNGYGIMHRTDAVFPVSEINFEGHSFMAPARPDAYLRDLYGDYMQLPPEDKRQGHAVFYLTDLSK